jgi:hypothetical protein
MNRMSPHREHSDVRASTGLFVTTLPGPTRRRTGVPYSFRLTYRNPDPGTPGCALLWQVEGGRLSYQIALEREENGRLRWHCTCADAIYRGEDSPHYCCKHVRGLLRVGRPGAGGILPAGLVGPDLDGAAASA